MKKHFLTDCVSSDARSINAMIDSSREITYRTFLRYVSPGELYSLFPAYARDSREGLTLKNDWHVRYFKSVYRGKECVYIRHSAIEYVFV